jgi:hypothetical protein
MHLNERTMDDQRRTDYERDRTARTRAYQMALPHVDIIMQTFADGQTERQEGDLLERALAAGALTSEQAEVINTVRKEGGVNAAAKALGVSSSTVSVQNRAAKAKLEEFGKKELQENARGEFEAQCFELFMEGGDVRTAVVKLRKPVDEIRGVYEKYVEVEGAWFVSASAVEEIHSQVDYITDGEVVENPEQLLKVLMFLTDINFRMRQFVYPCSVCGEPIPLSEASWKAAKERLVQAGWAHGSCHEKHKPRR